jgi:hypothetical protein
MKPSGKVIDFASFTAPLIGLAVSHIWRGYGSAIFLEMGELRSGRIRRDGSEGNPADQWTLGIEWSWRIEGKRRIWCGSWSDESRWPRAFNRMKGRSITSVSLNGRLPEISVSFSNGLHLLSMMTAEGDPAWWITRRTLDCSESISVRAARLQVDSHPGARAGLQARS